METISQQISALLTEQTNQSRLRQLKTANIIGPGSILINGERLINFASNDYLGLSQHPVLKERAIQAIEKYGVGCPSSRLISGNCDLYDIVESQIARLKGTEAALVFPTGFQANLTVLMALSKLNTFLLCDQFSHNSILLGAQWNKHKFARFEHNNVAELQRLAAQKNSTNQVVWAVTESVFSMGQLGPVDELVTISQNSDLHLYIDEAHATGVFGRNGMGFISKPDSKNVIMGTFGKGCGSFGAYIACSSAFKDFLTNFCPGIIYTTALPPSVLASIQAALELIPHMVLQRERLLTNASWLREQIRALGFSVEANPTQIIYLKTEDEQKALALSQYLTENKIYAPAIRPPTVPIDAAGIRISLSAVHEQSDIEYLLTVLRQYCV